MEQIREVQNMEGNRMTEKGAIRKSIKHWERMIKWAKKQDKYARPLYSYMELEINESWYNGDCALCRFYKDYCYNCILSTEYVDCYDDDSIWRLISDSNTWKEWIANAKQFLKQLKSLEEK